MKACFWHTLASILTAVFGAVYEYFSHGVYSYFMIYAFLIPLILGAFPSLCFAFFKHKSISSWTMRLYNCGIAALTVGSVFEGVLQIYGTTNRLIVFYPIVGAGLLAASLLIYAVQKHKAKGI